MEAAEEVVVASSSTDGGISCWNIRSGAELLRHRPCASPRGGLTHLSGRFLVSSQLPETPNAASAPIFLFSWDKPQVIIKSFPAEPIGPLVSNTEGTYIVGGGSSGSLYLWEVSSGRLFNKWNAHYQAVTCINFSYDESMLISGSKDGSICVWSLMKMFDEGMHARRIYSFTEHLLPVTDVVSGCGFTIIVSSSEDRTCKVWSLLKKKLLRTISFPCIINSIVLDPGEHVFFAGGRDGKIYIAALNAECNPNSELGMFVIGSLSDHSKPINCLAYSADGITLVSGSEDGTVRIWDARTRQVTRVLKHAKGPVNNVLIIREPIRSNHQAQTDPQDTQSRKRMHFLIPPPMDKYIRKTDGEVENKAMTMLQPPDELLDRKYYSYDVMSNLIKELQQQGSGAAEMEIEKSKAECKLLAQMAGSWKKLYQELQAICMDELRNENGLS